jgi:RNA polymerase sigma-70 factor (ECF subfamily)
MGSRHSSDEQLIERARGGNRAAQEELWCAHRRWVAAIVLAHRPRWAELEDLLQDVAVKLIGKIHTLRDAQAFRPWLRQITINICRGAARSSRSTLHLGSARPDEAAPREPGRVAEPAAPTDPMEDLESWDSANRVMQRALSLPLTYREPLLLRCVRSMSYQQISEMLDLPITTVETRLARARRMLREEIADAELVEDQAPASTRRNRPEQPFS